MRAVRGVLAAGFLVAALAGPTHASGAHCAASHSKTIASSPTVRVFSVPYGSPGRRVYACLRANGYRKALGMRTDDFGYRDWVGAVRTRRTLVAWEWEQANRYGDWEARVRVFDLRTKRTLRRWDDWPDSDCSRPGVVVNDLVLSPHGAIAWTNRGPGGQPCYQSQVVKYDGHVAETIYRSDSLDVHSLTWSRGRMYWQDSGETHSAPLP